MMSNTCQACGATVTVEVTPEAKRTIDNYCSISIDNWHRDFMLCDKCAYRLAKFITDYIKGDTALYDGGQPTSSVGLE